MALARYVVDAVVLEGRGVREVARRHGVSKTWVSVQLARYREGGYEALAPRSRRPKTQPNRTPEELEDEIVRLRKDLVDAGFDAGARTIAWHLAQRHAEVPSVSTIWRVLSRRGFIEPQPEKRPQARSFASRPLSPTSAGRPTSPIGGCATAPTSRSSTSSTTTLAWWWRPGCGASSR